MSHDKPLPDKPVTNETVTNETVTDGESLDFIRTLVTQDIAAGKHDGRVATRFPPEPNGYLHIGHAKSICLNFGVAEQFGGTCNLRFDDTNPETEDPEYVRAIQDDIRWLGFNWEDRLFFASDYFERLYDCAVQLIQDGKAYVDSLDGEKIREYRGTVTEVGRPSPYRDRTVEENLDLFARMRAGEFNDGDHVLRGKIDMAANNMLMRDPVFYRIRKKEHYRRGDAWCIYPLYDFTHCLSDAFEGITHSLCTLEFDNNREVYDWVIEHTGVAHQPKQTEFARLNLNYTMTSKRNLLQLVEEGHVSGWDDPRMATLSGLRRRGYTPESIRDFCDRVGVAKKFNVIDVALLEYSIRDDLNAKVPRVLAVLRPLKVVLDNYPEGGAEELEAPFYPHDVPKEGSRALPFSRELYIERDDFMEDPPEDYFRLAPGREVRLRYAYFIKCEKVIKNDDGEVVELRCSYDPATRGGNAEDGRKVSGTIHWVSAEGSVPAEVRLYDRLFQHENPSEGDFHENLNPKSLEVLTDCRVERSVGSAQPGDRFQFERQGYFIVDSEDSADDHLVFNRTVTLRDTWAKISQQEAAVQRDADAARKGAEKAAEKARQRELAKAASEEEAEALDPERQAAVDGYVGLGVAEHDARLLIADDALRSFFDSALKGPGAAGAVARWMVNELLRELKEKTVDDLPFGGLALSELVALVDGGKITGQVGKDVLAEMLETGAAPSEIVEKKGLHQVADAGELEAVIDRVLGEQADNVALYRGGKVALMGFFVGQVMKATRGQANAQMVQKLLREKLSG